MTLEAITVKVLTVADLHQSKTLYEQLEKAVRWHTPDLVAIVGDCLDLCDAGGQQLTKAECAQRLVGLACKELVFVRGNHESEGWAAFVTAWRASGRMRVLQALHAESFVLGPLAIVGFPCLLGDDFHYLEGRKSTQEDYSDKWLGRVMREPGSTEVNFKCCAHVHQLKANWVLMTMMEISEESNVETLLEWIGRGASESTSGLQH